MELIQRKYFNKREFRISDSKLYYSSSKFGNKNEVIISFEDIIGEKVGQTSTNSTLFFAGLTVFLAGIIMITIVLLLAEPHVDLGAIIFGLIVSLFGISLFVAFWLTKETFWKIKLADGRNLVLYQNLPDEYFTDKFISELFKSRNDFLRKNYMHVDKNLNYEGQLNTFRWLKSIQAISHDEFENLYNELKETVNPLKTNIGFKD